MDRERMPDAESAYVEEQKIRGYLLNHEHSRGVDKAVFFERFGFRIEQWRTLQRALLEHAATAELVDTGTTSSGGLQYELKGPLQSPDGRNPMVRTVWERHTGAGRYPAGLRLVTAHPARITRGGERD